MSEVQTTAAVLTLNKKPVTAADFKQNAEFHFAAATTATERYNEALGLYQHAVSLENIGTDTVISFNEGKGDKAETLTGRVITKLETGAYQVLVQFVGAPAKLSTVKPADVVAIVPGPAVGEPVEPIEVQAS